MKPNNGRLWAKMCDDKVEIRSLTEDKLEECLEILERYFFVNEPVSNGTEVSLSENVQARKELTELGRLAAKDGLSLVALEKSTGKPVAVIFNKIIAKPLPSELDFYQKFRLENTNTTQAQALLDFILYVESQCDVFEEFQIDCIFEMVFMSTLPDWHNKGLGRALIKYSIHLARELKNGHVFESIDVKLISKCPQAMTGIFSSKFTQKIAHTEDFKTVFKKPYSEFSYEGKTYDQRIDPVHEGVEILIKLI